MAIAISRCGIACEVCSHFNHGCMGCKKENRLKNICLIFRCAEEKNVEYCLRCIEYPCDLMRGLSKAYCPVVSEINIG